MPSQVSACTPWSAVVRAIFTLTETGIPSSVRTQTTSPGAAAGVGSDEFDLSLTLKWRVFPWSAKRKPSWPVKGPLGPSEQGEDPSAFSKRVSLEAFACPAACALSHSLSVLVVALGVDLGGGGDAEPHPLSERLSSATAIRIFCIAPCLRDGERKITRSRISSTPM